VGRAVCAHDFHAFRADLSAARRLRTALSAMLRIDPTRTHDGVVVLELAGEVRGPWVDELRRVAESALTIGAALRVDLRDVSFVDHRGAVLLNRLADRDVALVNCSAFVTEALKVRA
jgi:anti-anti-sigma regulatory factor